MCFFGLHIKSLINLKIVSAAFGIRGWHNSPHFPQPSYAPYPDLLNTAVSCIFPAKPLLPVGRNSAFHGDTWSVKTQACNQRGIPGGEEISERGPNFLKYVQ